MSKKRYVIRREDGQYVSFRNSGHTSWTKEFQNAHHRIHS